MSTHISFRFGCSVPGFVPQYTFGSARGETGFGRREPGFLKSCGRYE